MTLRNSEDIIISGLVAELTNQNLSVRVEDGKNRSQPTIPAAPSKNPPDSRQEIQEISTTKPYQDFIKFISRRRDSIQQELAINPDLTTRDREELLQELDDLASQVHEINQAIESGIDPDQAVMENPEKFFFSGLQKVDLNSYSTKKQKGLEKIGDHLARLLNIYHERSQSLGKEDSIENIANFIAHKMPPSFPVLLAKELIRDEDSQAIFHESLNKAKSKEASRTVQEAFGDSSLFLDDDSKFDNGASTNNRFIDHLMVLANLSSRLEATKTVDENGKLDNRKLYKLTKAFTKALSHEIAEDLVAELTNIGTSRKRRANLINNRIRLQKINVENTRASFNLGKKIASDMNILATAARQSDLGKQALADLCLDLIAKNTNQAFTDALALNLNLEPRDRAALNEAFAERRTAPNPAAKAEDLAELPIFKTSTGGVQLFKELIHRLKATQDIQSPKTISSARDAGAEKMFIAAESLVGNTNSKLLRLLAETALGKELKNRSIRSSHLGEAGEEIAQPKEKQYQFSLEAKPNSTITARTKITGDPQGAQKRKIGTDGAKLPSSFVLRSSDGRRHEFNALHLLGNVAGDMVESRAHPIIDTMSEKQKAFNARVKKVNMEYDNLVERQKLPRLKAFAYFLRKLPKDKSLAVYDALRTKRFKHASFDEILENLSLEKKSMRKRSRIDRAFRKSRATVMNASVDDLASLMPSETIKDLDNLATLGANPLNNGLRKELRLELRHSRACQTNPKLAAFKNKINDVLNEGVTKVEHQRRTALQRLEKEFKLELAEDEVKFEPISEGLIAKLPSGIFSALLGSGKNAVGDDKLKTHVTEQVGRVRDNYKKKADSHSERFFTSLSKMASGILRAIPTSDKESEERKNRTLGRSIFHQMRSASDTLYKYIVRKLNLEQHEEKLNASLSKAKEKQWLLDKALDPNLSRGKIQESNRRNLLNYLSGIFKSHSSNVKNLVRETVKVAQPTAEELRKAKFDDSFQFAA